MLLVLGAIGMGAVSGWSLSNYRLSGRNLILSLIALTVVATEIKAICHEVSILVVASAMVASFGLRFLVLNLLSPRKTARP
jgi:ABC-type glycerol-3-phosphate transport system permease component